jgi:branched-chain amino acid transport system substrate-binding protein
VRTSFTLPQVTVAMAEWANKNGIKKVVTLVSDYGPGIDAEKFFKDRISFNGGTVLEAARAAAQPRLRALAAEGARRQARRAVRLRPRAGRGLHEAVSERGLDKAGIRLIATGDVTDDDQLNDMGDGALGVVTSHHYSADHNSPVNKKFVEAFQKANPDAPQLHGGGRL